MSKLHQEEMPAAYSTEELSYEEYDTCSSDDSDNGKSNLNYSNWYYNQSDSLNKEHTPEGDINSLAPESTVFYYVNSLLSYLSLQQESIHPSGDTHTTSDA